MKNSCEYSDNLDTDFSNWEDDFFSENSHFSDVENAFDSKNLIKSLQFTANKISNQTVGTSFHQEEIFKQGNVEALSYKEIKTSNFGIVNASWNLIPQKDHKQIDISSQKKNKQNVRKYVHENSDSDDFCSPKKKYKKSKTNTISIFSYPEKDLTGRNLTIYSSKTFNENTSDSLKGIQHLGASKSQIHKMTTASQEFLDNQNTTISSQESCGSKMITSSQEMTTSQERNVSSQEISTSQKMNTSSQEISTSQKMNTSSQEISTSQKMNASSQEISTSQKMDASSQEIFTSQKMDAPSQEVSTIQKINTSTQDISTSKIMITSSQENSASQNISSSPEFCTSPKIISSSQESLGKQVMHISIEENSNILNVTDHSSSGAYVIVTPQGKYSNCQQSNSKILIPNKQGSSSNNTLPSKKMKTDFSYKNSFQKLFKSSISDTFCKKTYKKHKKTEKRIIWSIRKRELEVTKRENAVEIREKLLDFRQADIEKREQILKARERRLYLTRKMCMKKLIQESNANSKTFRKKVGILEDETNAINYVH